MPMVSAWLKKQGYTLPDRKQRDLQELWLCWYRGFVESAHSYRVFNGSCFQQAKRRTLGMAKLICEDYGSLLLNEHVQITSDAFEELPDVLEKNQFHTRANRLAELVMALGTGAFVEFLGEDKQPLIDYIRADMIYPLSWDGDNVTECAFASRKVIGEGRTSKTVFYVQLHVKAPGGWRIRNVYLDQKGKELPLPAGMLEESPVSPVPLFQLVRPNTINAADFDSPLGASVFAEALEQLVDCDIVWDSYINEFVLGKKRLMVPMSLAKLDVQRGKVDDNQGETLEPIFDPNDALIYVYEADHDSKQNPIELDLNLRTEQHEQGLQRCIDTLSKKCGLGVGRYRFDSNGAKTATEVISVKSDLYQSLKRHEKTFGDAIVGMVKALAWLMGKGENVDVTVQFDDSIVEDVNATIDRTIKLQSAGFMSKKDAIMTIFGVTEEEATKRLAEITTEERVDTDNVNAFFSQDEKPAGGDEA